LWDTEDSRFWVFVLKTVKAMEGGPLPYLKGGSSASETLSFTSCLVLSPHEMEKVTPMLILDYTRTLHDGINEQVAINY
jgi:hypothetical protein